MHLCSDLFWPERLGGGLIQAAADACIVPEGCTCGSHLRSRARCEFLSVLETNCVIQPVAAGPSVCVGMQDQASVPFIVAYWQDTAGTSEEWPGAVHQSDGAIQAWPAGRWEAFDTSHVLVNTGEASHCAK
jgi:hypothetical protein